MSAELIVVGLSHHTAPVEIRESLAWSRTHDASFCRAYLPYSYLGRPVLHALMDSVTEGDQAEALALIREHPGLVDPNY